MAIISSTDYFSYPMGGMMSFIRDILPYLVKYFDIELWGVTSYSQPFRSSIEIKGLCFPFFIFSKVKVHTRKIVPNIITVVLSINKKYKEILNRRYDVLYFHGIPLEVPFLKQRRKFRLVTHIHGVTNPFLYEHKIFAPFYEKLRNKVIRSSDISFIAADTPAYKRFLSNFGSSYGGKIIKVHNFADPDIFKPLPQKEARSFLGIPENAKIVVNTGRLSFQKDPVLYIETIKNLEAKVKDIQAFLIGDGPLRIELEKKIAQYNLNEKLTLVGKVERNQLRYWLNAADVFLYTSYGNGVPVSLVEALMCGIPIVTLDITGVHDIVINGETGYIVGERNPEMLAHAVEKVLEHTEHMRSRCIKKAQEFTPRGAAELIARNIYNLWE